MAPDPRIDRSDVFLIASMALDASGGVFGCDDFLWVSRFGTSLSPADTAKTPTPP
jgi:hypothetical protein